MQLLQCPKTLCYGEKKGADAIINDNNIIYHVQ